MALARTVSISQQGREGYVTYHEDLRSISGYQEFGGGDVVAIVSMGNVADWRKQHAWALDRRAEILRYVADEVIRQKAPSCLAAIDEAKGDILLRQSGRASLPAKRTADAAWVTRYAELKARFAFFLLVAACVAGLVLWIVSP